MKLKFFNSKKKIFDTIICLYSLAFLSGEDHGECVCGKCKCNEGYKNSDCGCATTNTSCIAASSGVCFLLFSFLF